MSPEPRPTPAPEPDTGNGTGQAQRFRRERQRHEAATNGQPGPGRLGAESALAAVERHLRQEAIEARLGRHQPTQPPTGSTTTVAPAAPSAVGRSRSIRSTTAGTTTTPSGPRPAPSSPSHGRPRPAPRRRAPGGRRLQARKVRRILRHVSPWSVFKFSLLFYLCVWLIFLVAGVILWRVGQEAGAISNVETFYAKATGEITFELDGRSVFRACRQRRLILVLAGTVFTVMLSLLFNLITDLTGGMRLTSSSSATLAGRSNRRAGAGRCSAGPFGRRRHRSARPTAATGVDRRFRRR